MDNRSLLIVYGSIEGGRDTVFASMPFRSRTSTSGSRKGSETVATTGALRGRGFYFQRVGDPVNLGEGRGREAMGDGRPRCTPLGAGDIPESERRSVKLMKDGTPNLLAILRLILMRPVGCQVTRAIACVSCSIMIIDRTFV
jgi:hypothetical protein